MKRNIYKNKIIISLIILLLILINIPVFSESINYNNEYEKQLITIKIGNNIKGLDAKYINISYDKTQLLINKL